MKYLSDFKDKQPHGLSTIRVLYQSRLIIIICTLQMIDWLIDWLRQGFRRCVWMSAHSFTSLSTRWVCQIITVKAYRLSPSVMHVHFPIGTCQDFTSTAILGNIKLKVAAIGTLTTFFISITVAQLFLKRNIFEVMSLFYQQMKMLHQCFDCISSLMLYKAFWIPIHFAE